MADIFSFRPDTWRRLTPQCAGKEIFIIYLQNLHSLACHYRVMKMVNMQNNIKNMQNKNTLLTETKPHNLYQSWNPKTTPCIHEIALYHIRPLAHQSQNCLFRLAVAFWGLSQKSFISPTARLFNWRHKGLNLGPFCMPSKCSTSEPIKQERRQEVRDHLRNAWRSRKVFTHWWKITTEGDRWFSLEKDFQSFDTTTEKALFQIASDLILEGRGT